MKHKHEVRKRFSALMISMAMVFTSIEMPVLAAEEDVQMVTEEAEENQSTAQSIELEETTEDNDKGDNSICEEEASAENAGETDVTEKTSEIFNKESETKEIKSSERLQNETEETVESSDSLENGTEETVESSASLGNETEETVESSDRLESKTEETIESSVSLGNETEETTEEMTESETLLKEEGISKDSEMSATSEETYTVSFPEPNTRIQTIAILKYCSDDDFSETMWFETTDQYIVNNGQRTGIDEVTVAKGETLYIGVGYAPYHGKKVLVSADGTEETEIPLFVKDEWLSSSDEDWNWDWGYCYDYSSVYKITPEKDMELYIVLQPYTVSVNYSDDVSELSIKAMPDEEGNYGYVSISEDNKIINYYSRAHCPLEEYHGISFSFRLNKEDMLPKVELTCGYWAEGYDETGEYIEVPGRCKFILEPYKTKEDIYCCSINISQVDMNEVSDFIGYFDDYGWVESINIVGIESANVTFTGQNCNIYKINTAYGQCGSITYITYDDKTDSTLKIRKGEKFRFDIEYDEQTCTLLEVTATDPDGIKEDVPSDNDGYYICPDSDMVVNVNVKQNTDFKKYKLIFDLPKAIKAYYDDVPPILIDAPITEYEGEWIEFNLKSDKGYKITKINNASWYSEDNEKDYENRTFVAYLVGGDKTITVETEAVPEECNLINFVSDTGENSFTATAECEVPGDSTFTAGGKAYIPEKEFTCSISGVDGSNITKVELINGETVTELTADSSGIYTVSFEEVSGGERTIKVYNQREEYTVTYSYNMEGYEQQAATVKAYNGDRLSEPSVPAIDGYSFEGWYKDAECTNAWDFAADTVTSDITLYAKWVKCDEPAIYTVSFDMKGCGAQIEPKTVTDGGKLEEPSKPEADGYSFEGWYKDAEYTNVWDFAADTVTSDITLYAKWAKCDEPAIYTVTFDMKGHGAQIEPITVADSGKLEEPSKPEAEDGIFEGWYKDAECTDAWDFAADTVTGNITLYAKWTAVTIIKDTNAKLEVVIPSVYFNNKIQKVKPNVFYNSEKLTQNIDYMVTYPDNDYKTAGEKKVEIEFRGSYTGSVVRTYRIYEKNAADTVNISKQKFSLKKADVQSAYYTGNAVTPAVISGNTALKENENYRVVYKNNYNAGKATVTVIGLGNTGSGTVCVGTKTLSFSIKKVNIKENVISNYTKTYPYKGMPVTLDDLSLTICNGSYKLKNGTDYTVSYKKNSTAGTATATVKGKGNFTGSVKYTYTIKPVSLADIPDGAVTSVEYSSKGAKLKTITFGDITLKEGTDYKAKYTYSNKKTKAVGTAVTIELTGKNACKGTSKIFRDVKIVAADFNNCIVPSDIVIDSKKVNSKRTVKVKDSAGVALKEGSGKDYTLVWDTANEGKTGKELTLTILPNSDNYTGKKEVPYRIAAKIPSVKNLKINNKVFDGKHPVTITADDIADGKLTADDFEVVSYKNNTKAGTAQVTIKGTGAYYGTRTLKFKITD